MTILNSTAEIGCFSRPVLSMMTVFAILMLTGMPFVVHAADLSIRIYERGGKAPIQDVSVCIGTPARINQFGAELTGPDGAVTFKNVPGTSLVITASKSGYKAEQQSLITNNMNRMLVLTLPTGGGGPVCDAGSARKRVVESALSINQFRINKGMLQTATTNVFLNHVTNERPTHYRASENPDFRDADWQVYTAEPEFKLSTGNGRKVVYFQVRRFSDIDGADLEALSPVVQDSINLQRP
jgi:hypothetical protein